MPVIDAKRRPVTRDRTQSFKRFRAQQRRKRQDGYQPHGGQPEYQQAQQSDPESPVKGGQAYLPPRWVDFADKAKEEIKEIRDQLVQLAKAQQRRLLRADGPSGPDQEVEAIAASIAMQIRVCEQSIHQVRTCGAVEGGSLMDDEFRQNTQRSLAAQLQQLSKQCREQQRDYMQEVKRRQRAAAGPQPGDLENGGGGGASGSGQGLSQTQVLELENMEDFAAQRSSEVAQIASSIEELNRIFRELAVLVIDQGSILDRIDYNTEKIYKKSDDGRKQMEKAVKTKRNTDTRTMWCFIGWAAADALALLILLIKWQIKYGLKNVLIFILVMTVLSLGTWFGWKYVQPVLCPKCSLQGLLPEWCDPNKLWKKYRPGPVNAAKAAAAGTGVGGGLNAMRHVWRPPG